MKCVICGDLIGKNDNRTYAIVWRGERHRKIYACWACNLAGTFDAHLDAMERDEDGRTLDNP